MSYILNIGLAREGKSDLTLERVLTEVRAAGLIVETLVIAHSDTEETAVITATNGYSYTPLSVRMTNLALELDQDCIAFFYPVTRQGVLYGPRAAAWGQFNPEFFFMPDRTRLANPTQLAA